MNTDGTSCQGHTGRFWCTVEQSYASFLQKWFSSVLPAVSWICHIGVGGVREWHCWKDQNLVHMLSGWQELYYVNFEMEQMSLT